MNNIHISQSAAQWVLSWWDAALLLMYKVWLQITRAAGRLIFLIAIKHGQPTINRRLIDKKKNKNYLYFSVHKLNEYRSD